MYSQRLHKDNTKLKVSYSLKQLVSFTLNKSSKNANLAKASKNYQKAYHKAIPSIKVVNPAITSQSKSKKNISKMYLKY